MIDMFFLNEISEKYITMPCCVRNFESESKFLDSNSQFPRDSSIQKQLILYSEIQNYDCTFWNSPNALILHSYFRSWHCGLFTIYISLWWKYVNYHQVTDGGYLEHRKNVPNTHHLSLWNGIWNVISCRIAISWQSSFIKPTWERFTFFSFLSPALLLCLPSPIFPISSTRKSQVITIKMTVANLLLVSTWEIINSPHTHTKQWKKMESKADSIYTWTTTTLHTLFPSLWVWSCIFHLQDI
jgi:hypothetical protein